MKWEQNYITMSRFEILENTDLYKAVLNKTMTTQRIVHKTGFRSPFKGYMVWQKQ